MSWIDISAPIGPGMPHWPGDPHVEVERFLALSRGDSCNVTRIALSAHTGTHMDAPLHFVHSGAAIDDLPFDAVIGPARVLDMGSRTSIGPEELARHDPRPGERILFRTSNSGRDWVRFPFEPEFVHISAEGARYLAQCGVRTVGIDYLSVGAADGSGDETHRILLDAGIWIIEGLNLGNVRAGSYDLICLPLRLAGADGAPARAILRPIA